MRSTGEGPSEEDKKLQGKAVKGLAGEADDADYSPEGLMQLIHTQWKQEMTRVDGLA